MKRNGRNAQLANTLGIHEEAKLAYVRLKPKMEEITRDEMMTIRVDVTRAVGIVLNAEPRISQLIPDMRKHVPTFDIQLIEDVRPAALALWYAHAAIQAVPNGNRVDGLMEEGRPLARALRNHALSLSDWKVLEADRVDAIGTGRSYRKVAKQLVAWAGLFRSQWSAIEGKTPVTEADLARAEIIGGELVHVLGAHDIAPATVVEGIPSGEERIRAFTLLSQIYDEVRKAVAYLRRREGDSETIAPSLYRVRARRSAKPTAAEDAPAPALPEPTAPPPRDG